MKIEKMNEQQIRCTLTKKDLADRHIQIGELAYGTEKTRTLFRDIMQQASEECGFDVEDIPLMIEAVPMGADRIILIATKVEDPEELDTRFAKFAPSIRENRDDEAYDDEDDDGMDVVNAMASAEEVLDMLRRFDRQSKPQDAETAGTSHKDAPASPVGFDERVYAFDALHTAIRAAHIIAPLYQGASTLYKDSEQDMYLLLLQPHGMSAADCNRLDNTLAEYTLSGKVNRMQSTRLEEHCDAIIRKKAVERLANL